MRPHSSFLSRIAVSLPEWDGQTRKRKCRRAFAVSVLACLISALCAAPALAQTYTGISSDLQNPPAVGGFPGSQNTFAPNNYLTANPSNNTITINNPGGANNPVYVFGGFSENGTTEKNTVELISGAVTSAVIGGASYSGGNAIGNTINISGGDVGGSGGGVYGGRSSYNGNATGNTVNISGGAFADSIQGGYSYDNGNVIGNTVNISEGISSNVYVHGGYSQSNGNVSGNTVNISGGSWYWVYGGRGDDKNNITGNTVNISEGGTVRGEAYGGMLQQNGNVTGNVVNISGGKVGGSVYGGAAITNGTSKNNTVNISGGDVTGYQVRGGYAVVNGIVEENTVNISGGNITTGVYGGRIQSTGTTRKNEVNVSGGSVSDGVTGGYTWDGSATDNTVTLSGGIVSNGVTGGYAGSGTATGNIVNISGNANIVGVTALYGGDGNGTDKRTGNTLYVNNWKGSNAGSANIANFQNYHFTLPASVSNGANILSTTGNVTLSSQSSEQTRVALDFAGQPAALRPGDKINLIKASGANADTITSDGTIVNTSAPSTYGATDYLFDIAVENSNTTLTATLAQKQVNQDKAKSYLYGTSARLTSLVNGADHMVSIMDNWKCAPETPTTTGFCSFASMQGSTIKTRTGSSINNNGASFALGGAFDTATRLGTLTTGLFAEGGIGSYNSYSRFGWGDGDTWHYGIGAFAKHAFTNRIYLEGSARIGRAKTDFDGKGSIADLHYNSEGNYWGAHAGVGIDYPLNTVSSMDTYAKLLWTHQDSDTVTTRAKERLSFDSADSLRSRLGTRYRHRVEENLRAHVGVGWEYEFDGRERARLDGTKIAHEPETQGHSALLEAGIEWRATKSWSVNANATAMGGQRRGLTGYAQAIYHF
jgi:hypothetical protein